MEQSAGIVNIIEIRGDINYDSRKNETFCTEQFSNSYDVRRRKSSPGKYGADKVYDFSLGNPSVPAPDCVREAIIDLVNNEEPMVLHGYMNNAGFEDVRETIAQSLNRRFGTAFSGKKLIMTVGRPAD